MSDVFVPAILTLVISWIGTGLVRAYALKHQLLDVANERSMHERPTPRGGGLAIVVAFYVGLTCLAAFHTIDRRLALAFVVGGVPIAAIGWIDDRRQVSSAIRLVVHILSCGGALLVVGPYRVLPPELGSVWLLPLWAVAMAWCVNLYNFMDGLDGFSGSEGVFVGIAGALLFQTAVGVSGAALLVGAGCLGFLIWNWPPAKIFMGDCASGFLGFCFALLAMATGRQAGLFVWPMLLSVFVADATLTLLSRAIGGEPWTKPHNTHAFQLLAKRSGHLPVTIGLSILNLLVVLPLAYLAARQDTARLLVVPLFVGLAIAVIALRRTRRTAGSANSKQLP